MSSDSEGVEERERESPGLECGRGILVEKSFPKRASDGVAQG